MIKIGQNISQRKKMAVNVIATLRFYEALKPFQNLIQNKQTNNVCLSLYINKQKKENELKRSFKRGICCND